MATTAKTDLMVYKDLVELPAGMGKMERGESQEPKAHVGLLAQVVLVVESSTQDGVGQFVPVRREHSCCMQED